MLLDLTKRNRALHFRATRVSSVVVVGEQPAKIFRRLVPREQAMRFKAAREPDAAGAANDASAPDGDGEDDGELGEVLGAPLVLIPVALARKSARADYHLRVCDDEPIVNPALAEYLRRSFGVQLPDLPDPSTLGEEYDLQQFLRSAIGAIGTRPR